MKTNVAETSLVAFHSTPVEEFTRREQEIMVLFGDPSVRLSRKQIWKILCEALGDQAPGEGGVTGRVNSLMAKRALVNRGEIIDPRTKKPQELVGLPIKGQRSLFGH